MEPTGKESQEGRFNMPSPAVKEPGVGRNLRMRVRNSIALLGFALCAAAILPGGSAAPPSGVSDKEPTVDGRPLFDSWPQKGQQQPDATIIFTGQTYGFLQPCGCSRPQKGGLERRMHFINILKSKGWPVAGVDLGDVYPDKAAIKDQALLRYKTSMQALKEMGYIAVGVGKTEFMAEIDKVIGEYALQGPNPPYLLAGNLMGVVQGKPVSRKEAFQAAGVNRPFIDAAEVAKVGSIAIGVAGLVGKSVAEEMEKAKWDPNVTFQKIQGQVNNAQALKEAVNSLNAAKSQLNVLIYQGSAEEAAALAKDWPQFPIILCRSEESELPSMPEKIGGGKTLLIKVGDKGRHVGVLGIFRKNGGFDFHYQLVPLDEYYITPGTEAEVHQKNKVLALLERYTQTLRDSKTVNNKTFLEDFPKVSHRAQVAEPNLDLSYVGSDTCKACHAAEFAVWAKSQHANAYNTLARVAKRPSLRNYDPECIVCHTVGFEYQTGYVDEKKTPELKNVGCENCHGPGSGHAANPKAGNLLPLLSPWKKKGRAGLPADLIKKMAETPLTDRGKIRVDPADQLMINLTGATCGKCHDPDNDPHFDFYTYWPKINHSGMAPPGGWPSEPPKKPNK